MTSSSPTARMAEVRSAITLVSGLLKDITPIIHQVPNGELGSLVGDLGHLRALAEAGMVVATADAEQRGEIAASQARSTAGWVREQDWHSQLGGAAAIAKAAAIIHRGDLTPVADAIRTSDLPANVAATVATEYDKLRPELEPEACDAVLDQMIEAGSTTGARTVRELRELLLCQYGRDGIFQDEQDSKARYVNLSNGRDVDGVFQYQLELDAEGKAALESAIGPLSAPHPGPDGRPDPRSNGRRRGEALIAVCRRSTEAADRVPAQPKAALYVMITERNLADCAGAGTVVGGQATGTLLAAETVRKLACDAAIIPVLRNHRDEILSIGAAKRYFTLAQIKALWARDQHCTFDNCDAPPHWTEAHHLKHWADGGPTNIENGALLCGRHHTIVHRDKLAGRLVNGRIVWDTRPGSYQQLLAAAAS